MWEKELARSKEFMGEVCDTLRRHPNFGKWIEKTPANPPKGRHDCVAFDYKYVKVESVRYHSEGLLSINVQFIQECKEGLFGYAHSSPYTILGIKNIISAMKGTIVTDKLIDDLYKLAVQRTHDINNPC